MRNHLKVLSVAIVIAFLILAFTFRAPIHAYADEKTTTEEWGDVIHVLIPVFAVGSTFFTGAPDGSRWDKEGTSQSVKGIGTAVVSTAIWKRLADKMRPNQSSSTSFPSGHASFAFSGAGFIDTRYGHKWGIPALLGAAFVGYSRVYADAHFADDATAGAAVGLLSSWIFTTPQSESRNVSVLPMLLEDGAGLQVTFRSGKTTSDEDTKKVKTGHPRARFNFGFGPQFLAKNEITSPSATGTIFDLEKFNKDEDPTTTAAITFDIFLNDRNELSIFWWPFESRDTGIFTNPVSFAGQIFPANTQIQSDWIQYNLQAAWRYNLTPSSPWDVKAGVGLLYQNTEVDLSTSTLFATVQDWVLLPYLSASVGYQITPKWLIALSADGIYLSDDSMLDAVGYVNYKISDRWDFSLGYRYYERDIETSELTNRVIYTGPYGAIAFSWLSG